MSRPVLQSPRTSSPPPGSTDTPRRLGAVVYRAIASLRPAPGNPRAHRLRQIQQIAASIETFGFVSPVLLDAQDEVIAGHGRLLAAQALGWREVPTLTLAHLTPAQVQAYRIADNRLTECSAWDDKLLAEQLALLASVELDFDLSVTGFELPEIDLRIQSLELDAEPEQGLIPDLAQPVISQLGDLWQLGPHRLLCGNALEAASYDTLLGNQPVVAVFTDPPYNVPIHGHVMGKGAIQHREFPMASGEMDRAGFTRFLATVMAHLRARTVPGAVSFVCMDWRHLEELTAAFRTAGLEPLNLCVWAKDNAGMGSLYRSQHELIYVLRTPGEGHYNAVQLGQYGRHRSNVWQYPGVNSFARRGAEGNVLALHPTVKPTAMVADALMDVTRRGESVLDPFAGSGTTLMAAERTGRVAYVMELDPAYVDTIVRRWERATGQQAIHVGTRLGFDALQAQRSALRQPAPSRIEAEASGMPRAGS